LIHKTSAFLIAFYIDFITIRNCLRGRGYYDSSGKNYPKAFILQTS